MNEIQIYRANGIEIEKIKPDDNSVQAKRVMGENELRLVFRLGYFVNFKINDYCTVFLEKYKLNKLPIVTKHSVYYYEYQMTMEAEGFDLSKIQYLYMDGAGSVESGDFSLTGTADTFIDMLLNNANRASLRTGPITIPLIYRWSKGQVIPTDVKTLNFKSENCYNALAHIAEAFETEFAIEGSTIHLTARQQDLGITLRHGRGKGLYEITRQNVDNSRIITRLYAYGSEKNLPVDYRGGLRRLKLPDSDYLEVRTGEYGYFEDTQFFEDIYPQRTGKVTSINISDPFRFYDTTLNFNINSQLIPGVGAKVVFKTGQLAGYTFEIGKYDNGTKEVTILKNKDEKVLDLPSTDFKPAIGDTYVLVDIIMPQTYIDAAELALKNKAIEVLEKYSEPQLQYTIVPDPSYMEKRKVFLRIGDKVWMNDTHLNLKRQIRIVAFLRNIVQEFSYTVELSDVLSKSPITLLQSTSVNQGRDIGIINQQINVLNENNLGALPTITNTAGYSQVYINDITGKLARKV